MKYDKEIRWLVKILSVKKHRRRLITGLPISKREFEKIAEAPENDKGFSNFFRGLIHEGIMIQKGDKYLIEPNKAVNKIRSYPYGNQFWKLVLEHYWRGLK